MNLISNLTGSLLMFLYNILGQNYGIAIVVFTILFKLVLMPLTLKSTRASKKQMELQPQVVEIQELYKDDRELMAKKLQELYAENNVNMFGGCLPLLIQIPIIFAVFATMSRPLTYCLKYDKATVDNLTANVESISYKEVIAAEKEGLNFNFLGINIGTTPKFNFEPENIVLWIFPILSGLTTYLSLKVGMSANKDKKKSQTEDSSMAMMNNMNVITPIMSAYVSFIAPIGLSIYWIVGNIFQVFQQLVILPMYVKNTDKANLKNNVQYEVVEESKSVAQDVKEIDKPKNVEKKPVVQYPKSKKKKGKRK